MEPMTLAVAGVAAAGDRPDRGRRRQLRQRSGISRPPGALCRRQDGRPRPPRAGQGGIGELIAQSAALASLNRVVEQRDFGANLAARHRPRRPQAQAVRVPADLGRLDRRRSRSRCSSSASSVLPALGNPLALLIGAFIGFMLPRFWLGRRKSGRLNAFNKQLPDTITLIANALRAGSSFLQAIELVVRESRPPISTEFGRVIREVNLGLPFDQALENMVRRVRSDDLELMATAITIQHQVGGNLAEILDSIAYTIRERVRIKGEIRTLTAQQRLSGYVVGFLPIGLAGFLFIAAPELHGADVRQSAGRPRPAGRRDHPALRRVHDVHRLHVHPPHRRHRGLADADPSPSSSPALAAGAILLIVLGLAGSSPVDPVQARLTQLGHDAGQEPRGARAPAAVHRADAAARWPPRLSGRMSRDRQSTSFTERTEKRLALAGNPGDLRVADWLGHQGRSARSSAAIIFFLLFVVVGMLELPPVIAHRCMAVVGVLLGYTVPGVLAGRPRQEAPERHPADDPGHARPADDLRPGRPRLRRRARQGRREAQGPAVGRVPPGAGRGPRRQGAPRCAARHRPAHRGRRR